MTSSSVLAFIYNKEAAASGSTSPWLPIPWLEEEEEEWETLPPSTPCSSVIGPRQHESDETPSPHPFLIGRRPVVAPSSLIGPRQEESIEESSSLIGPRQPQSSSSSSRSSSRVIEISLLEEDEVRERERTTLKAQLGALIERTGENYQRPGGKGFVLDGRVCAGALRTLSKCFYGDNFVPVKTVRSPHASSKEIGENFHRVVYHHYKCSPSSCLCRIRFKKATRAISKTSAMQQRLSALCKFLHVSQWQVFDCELVVGFREMYCATSIDVVCVDKLSDPRQMFVIELKTGYQSGRYTPRTSDGLGMMKGVAGREIENSYANQHQLQLWFGMEALWRTYGIRSAQGVVLYINDDGTYKADFARSWWFNNKSTRDLLYKQLGGSR